MADGWLSLTEEQRSAVDYDGNLLLTACPGSGKTRTVVAKLVAEVEALRGTPFGVACITYTNAAVHEIEHRAALHLMAGDDRHLTVSTIHAFCLNLVLRPFAWRLPGFSGSFQILTRDRPEFETIADWAAAQVNLFNLRYEDYEAFSGLSLDTSGNLTENALENEAVSRAAPYFWKRCAELGFLDFATILYKSYCLLRDDDDVTRSLAIRYPVFVIDEFQDTTEIQIAILRLLHKYELTKFFLVGDLAQSIFGFAGAKPELVAPFAKEICAKTDIVLSANFRSGPLIIEHAERIYPRSPPMFSAGKSRTCTIPPKTCRPNSVLAAIMDNFLPALAEHGIGFGEAAILARTWAPLFPLSRALRERGIPVVGPGARPYRRSLLFAALAEQLCAASDDPSCISIRQLERTLHRTLRDATGRNIPEAFGHEGRVAIVELLQASKALMDGGASAWLDAMATAASDILQAAGWINSAQAYLFPRSADDMKADMRKQKVDVANLSIEDLGMFASPKKAIRLMTVHNAKGHEFKAVALIGMIERTFPFFRAIQDGDVEGEERLFYVGITRAEKLLMYIAEHNRWGNPPSRFLSQVGAR